MESPQALLAQQLSLLLQSRVGIFSLDNRLCYTSFNTQHAEAVLGAWSVVVRAGMAYLDEVVLNDLDRIKARQNLERALSGEDFEVVEAYGRDDSRRLFETRYAPIRDGHSTINGVLVVASDVSERVRLAEERAALERKLLEASQLESLGLMVGSVAHDFNNLLVPILLSAEMARAGAKDDEAVRSHLDTVIQSTKSASDLTKQLLSFSGNELGSLQVVDLNELIRNTTELARVAVRRRASLQMTLMEQPLRIMANATQLRQVVSNLLINASEAAEGPHPRVTIETSTLRVAGELECQVVFPGRVAIGDYAVLSVRDNGCGMTTEQLNRIFEPFFSTKGTGRGFGLTAVQGIVRKHRGFLAINSSPGKGSHFRIGIPLASDSYADIIETAMTEPFQVAESMTVPMRILIVDDNERSLSCLKMACERMGHSVEVASSGMKAIVAVNARPYDLMILDADLADVPCTEILKAIPDGIKTPVALMSGTPDEAALIANPRVHSTLSKPFTLESLIGLLQRFQPRGGRYTIEGGVTSGGHCIPPLCPE